MLRSSASAAARGNERVALRASGDPEADIALPERSVREGHLETPFEAMHRTFCAPIICWKMNNVNAALGPSSLGAWMSHAITAARRYSRGAASRWGPV